MFINKVNLRDRSSDKLALIKKEKTGSLPGTAAVNYQLIRTSHPNWQKLLLRVADIFTRSKSSLISYEETRDILYKAANEKEDYENPLINTKEFRQVAQLFEGIEEQEHKNQRPLTSGMIKFRKAAERAKKIGKGIIKAEKKGYKPLMIHEDYHSETIRNIRNDPRFNEWKNSDSKLSFEEFIKDKENVEEKKVAYLTKENRLEYKVGFSEGCLQTAGGVPLQTKHEIRGEDEDPNVFAFVIGPDESVYAGPHVDSEFHHSSFLSGGAVISAGEIETNAKGKVIKISNRSGHYKPGIEPLLSSLSVLEKNGVDLSSVKASFATLKGIFTYDSGSQFLSSKGRCPPNHYEMEDPFSGDMYLISIDRNSLGKINKLTVSPESGRFLIAKAYENLKELGFDFMKLEFADSFKILELGRDTYEYEGNAFIKNEGKVLPTSWTGGYFEKKNEEVVGIHIDKVQQGTMKNPEQIEYLKYLLFKLRDQGLNLEGLNLYDKDNSLLSSNANEFLMGLI